MPSYSHMSLEHDREYRCCLCFHVRTGTVLLGLFQLLAHMVVLSIMFTYLINPQSISNYSHSNFNQMENSNTMDHRLFLTDPGIHMLHLASNKQKKLIESKQAKDADLLKTILDDNGSEIILQVNPPQKKSADNNGASTTPVNSMLTAAYSRTQSEELWHASMTLMSLFFTYLLLHGVLYRRASYLLPYFSLQVFDFVLACLKVMGYMTYMPHLKDTRDSAAVTIAEVNNKIPSDNGGNINEEYMTRFRRFGDHSGPGLALVSLAFLILALKAYLMGMVWSTYKYLVLHQRLYETGGLSYDDGYVHQPTGIRGVVRDVWSQMRSLWTSEGLTGAYATRGGLVGVRIGRNRRTPGGGVGGSHPGLSAEADSLLNVFPDNDNDLRDCEPPAEVVEPPKYEELLKQPANAHMPPPYFHSSGATAITPIRSQQHHSEEEEQMAPQK